MKYAKNGKPQTKWWGKLVDGQSFNQRSDPPLQQLTDTMIDFVNGRQWRNIETNGAPTPVLNIFKRALTYFVAMITSSKTSAIVKPLQYSDTESQDETQQPTPEVQMGMIKAELIQAEIENIFEKWQMDYMIRDTLFKAGTMGDCAWHVYWDKRRKPYGNQYKDVRGEMVIEIVNNLNYFLGNPNNPVVSIYTQPYVIVSGRDMVEYLIEEAKQHAKNNAQPELIISDTNYQHQAGASAKIEIESDDKTDKAEFMTAYWYDTKTETIHKTKCTETAYIYEDIDTGLTEYPVIPVLWEKQEGTYHGRPLGSDIVDNQIFINQMLSMVMYHLMNAAFPKVLYNGDKTSKPTNRIAGAIEIRGMQPGETLRNVVDWSNPGEMSAQIMQVIEFTMQTTKDLIGINDTALGNINPEQASGVAIQSVVQQAGIPIENTKGNLYQGLENLVYVMIDMASVYYGERPIIVSESGTKSLVMFDFATIKDMWTKVQIDVGASSYWAEGSQVAAAKELLAMKDPLFQIIDYLETLPSTFRNSDLVERVKSNLKKMTEQQTQQAEQQTTDQQTADQAMQGQAQGEQSQKDAQYANMETWLNEQNPEMKRKIMQLPPNEQEATILKLMQEGVKNIN